MLCRLSNFGQRTFFDSIGTIFHTPAANKQCIPGTAGDAHIRGDGMSRAYQDILLRASEGVSPKASL